MDYKKDIVPMAISIKDLSPIPLTKISCEKEEKVETSGSASNAGSRTHFSEDVWVVDTQRTSPDQVKKAERRRDLKFLAVQLSGILFLIVCLLFLVRGIYEFSGRKDDELILVALIFAFFACLLLASFLFGCVLVTGPKDCQISEESQV